MDDRADELSFKDQSYGVGVVADPYPELAARRAEAGAHPGAFSAWFGIAGPEQVVYGSCPHVSVLSYKGVEAVVKDDATYSSTTPVSHRRRNRTAGTRPRRVGIV